MEGLCPPLPKALLVYPPFGDNTPCQIESIALKTNFPMTEQKGNNNCLPCASLNQSCPGDFGNHMLFRSDLNVLILSKTVNFS